MPHLLGALPWSFNRTHYPDRASFVAAVQAYSQRIFKRDAPWNPDERVVAATRIRLRYEAVRGGAYDDAFTVLTTDAPEGFTAGELLWRIHEALAEDELADHCFFEGFSHVKDDLYGLHQGS